MKAFNFEIYTINPETKETGWEIVFRTVFVNSDETDTRKSGARAKLAETPLFDCVILFNWCIDVDMSNLSESDLRDVNRGYSDTWGN
jgi:hypothetical protein